MEQENNKSISPERLSSFENQVRENEKNKKNNLLFRTIFFLVILFSICLLPFLSPFSCRNMVVSGNYLLSKSDILSYANYKTSTPLIFVDDELLLEKLNEKEYILKAEVSWSIVGLEVEIDELACLLKVEEDEG